MSFSKLYNYVETLTSVPIRIEGLVDSKILQLTPHDKIWYVPVELDEKVSLGHYKSYRGLAPPYTAGDLIAEVRYSNQLNDCWKRFVCCKELMHLFDRPDEKVDNPAKYQVLLNELASNPIWTVASPSWRSESIAEWMAMAILCPRPIRNFYKQKLADGEMTENGVAFALRLPQHYIQDVMNEGYDITLDFLLQDDW